MRCEQTGRPASRQLENHAVAEGRPLRLTSATSPTIASTGIQIGDNTATSTTPRPRISARADTPTAARPTIETPSRMPKPSVSGSNFTAMTAAMTRSTTFRNVFMSRKPGSPRKVASAHATALFSSRLNPPAPLPVVCAVITDAAGRVLLAQRPAHKHLGLKWEFPGGKVEPGESPEAALVREIREELGCDIALTRALPRFTHDYGTVVIEMIPFVATLASASPTPLPHEHVALTWCEPATLRSYDLAPADWPVVDALLCATT